MEYLIPALPFFIFIFGLLIGSFLNVVIYRYNTGRSVAQGRSCCFSCGKTLKWYELVPVISYLWQGKKCRSCKSVLSAQYIAVELTTGILFTLVALRLGVLSLLVSPAALITAWILVSLAIVITVYDLRHTIIPDGPVFLLDIIALGVLYFRGGGIADLLVGIIAALIFAGIWYFSGGRAMGFGDAKLVLGLGWLLPFPQSISGIFSAFWLGAIIGVVLLVIQRKKVTMKTEIPFAPFLIAGTLIVFLANISLIAF